MYQIQMGYAVCEAIAHCIAFESNKRLLNAKLDAINKAQAITEAYLRCSLRPSVVLKVLEKKLAYVKSAKQIQSLNQITDSAASYPRLEFGSWKTGPYHIPEEEILFWGTVTAGLRVPQAALERALALYEEYIEPPDKKDGDAHVG